MIRVLLSENTPGAADEIARKLAEADDIKVVGYARDGLEAAQMAAQLSVEGISYTQIVTIRDGENWKRHRQVFFDHNHELGAWDHALGWIAAVAEVDAELYFQYAGLSTGYKVGRRAIGMAKLRKDDFFSLDATETGGFLQTPLVILDGSRLSANVNATGAKVKVQVVDESDSHSVTISESTPDVRSRKRFNSAMASFSAPVCTPDRPNRH